LIFNDQDELLLTKRGLKAKNEVGKWEKIGWFSLDELGNLPLSLATRSDFEFLNGMTLSEIC
jgi:hypothetical protein